MGRPRKEKIRIQEGQEPPAEASTVTIRFDESGKPRPMQPETRERLRAAMPQLGLSEDLAEGEMPNPVFAEKVFDGLCVAVPWMQSLLLELFTGLSPDKTREILRYTKEEKAEMRESAVALLAEHLSALWHMDPNLYTLLIVIAAFHIGKIARVNELQKKTASNGGDERGGGQ